MPSIDWGFDPNLSYLKLREGENYDIVFAYPEGPDRTFFQTGFGDSGKKFDTWEEAEKAGLEKKHLALSFPVFVCIDGGEWMLWRWDAKVMLRVAMQKAGVETDSHLQVTRTGASRNTEYHIEVRTDKKSKELHSVACARYAAFLEGEEGLPVGSYDDNGNPVLRKG